jgi:hypothetical protein
MNAKKIDQYNKLVSQAESKHKERSMRIMETYQDHVMKKALDKENRLYCIELSAIRVKIRRTA